MDTQRTSIDRRIKRSHQLLKQSFLELIKEKGFSSITIQDITDRADVNRGTFYAHFPDKYALLELTIREKFQKLLEEKLPPSTEWENEHLRLLIKTVLEYFKGLHGRCNPIDTVNPLFERAIQEELAALLLQWFEQLPVAKTEWRVPIQTLALMISWSIFGLAIEWSRGKSAMTMEQTIDDTLAVITEGIIRLAPAGLLD